MHQYVTTSISHPEKVNRKASGPLPGAQLAIPADAPGHLSARHMAQDIYVLPIKEGPLSVQLIEAAVSI